MLLYENLAIGVKREAGGLWRAYAFDPITEQNVAKAKASEKDDALRLLFEILREDAIEALSEQYDAFRTVEEAEEAK